MTILAMSLRISGHGKTIAKWAIIGTLGILFLVFFVRVAVWEANYYNEKDGSEREVLAAETQQEELVEEKPSDDDVRNYYVSAEKPRYLTISKLGVEDARILPVSINSDGAL
jgi:hypothetical protein